MEKDKYLSVHELVDFLLRSGDIDSRVFNATSLKEGTLLHSLYQKKQNKNYLSEYFLKGKIKVDDVLFTIEGRADGIIKKKDGYLIDEIKTTLIDLKTFKEENFLWHIGQAKVYAYLFLKEKKLNHIGVQLTYISQNNIKDKLQEKYYFTEDELEKFITDLLKEYLLFYRILEVRRKKRNISIKNLTFPFSSFRKGQKELMKYSYSLCKKGGTLFAQAPTGIGKTMSTLFPYIKYLLEDDEARIFYLTAKGSGKEAIHQAYSLLAKSGLELGSIILTSKEKICFCPDKGCNPLECPYTINYYFKIKKIIHDLLLTENDFTYEKIVDIAKKEVVCPFELQLDLSLFLDLIICDYNYVFDPSSYLKRFYDKDTSHYLLLVDEAHNLVERSKDMYSAEIKEIDLLTSKKAQKGIVNPKIDHALNKILNYFHLLHEEENNEASLYNEAKFFYIGDNFLKPLQSFHEKIIEANKKHHEDVSKDLFNFYLSVNRFLKIYEFFDETYLPYIYKDNLNKLNIKLFCLNPSHFIKKIKDQHHASLFFSATLSPFDYYINLLGGDNNNDPLLKLPSPFLREHLKIFVAPNISIKYKNRDKTYSLVENYIKTFTKHKKGNYLIFLPSFEYLEHIQESFKSNNKEKYIFQKRKMLEEEKEDFLNEFNTDSPYSVIGFAIIGGSFAEGIDLVGEKLIGVIVIGIGFSKINFEDEEIRKYYDSQNLCGLDFAYIYPGMNKILQAIGRVIRSEEDKGAALLIDERYLSNKFYNLLKKEYGVFELVNSEDELNLKLSSFYKQ